MKTNILLIGMPYSGKSTVGKIVSKLADMPHIDGDAIIEAHEGMKLQQIIDTKGMEYFSSLEGKVLEELDLENYVISPGGSAIYYPEAMKHLAEICHIVYIRIGYEDLARRAHNIEQRGIVFKPGQTFKDLYDERIPLYEKYAEITVDSSPASPGVTAEKVLEAVRGAK